MYFVGRGPLLVNEMQPNAMPLRSDEPVGACEAE
jgi:hypothetical protein